MSRSKTGIPGLSFSWRRAIGLSRVESEISRKTGIPLTRSGRQKKLGRIVSHLIGWGLLGVVGLIGSEFVSHPDLGRAVSGLFGQR